MPKRILVMGLPGSGKTTLATLLANKLSAHMFNADDVRRQYNDWDFTTEGRLRQSKRMRSLCDLSSAYYKIADFVAPLPEMRENFNADWTIWLDTIEEGRFADTNKAFVPPKRYDFRVTYQNAEVYADAIAATILKLDERSTNS